MIKLASYDANQLVFLDESAANERTGDRKRAWSRIGTTPRVIRAFVKSKRWSILPAYTIDGFITWEILHGSYMTEIFDEFVRNKVLPLCNPYLGQRSVIFIDNATIHRSAVSSLLLYDT